LEITWIPTETGVTTPVIEGKMKKVKATPVEDVWELEISDAIMSTSFVASGIDLNHKPVQSIDLGNVGFDDRP